ncbi:MAG: four helix bundle protein [Fibromonadales bacterium]|nr:four helix bundle protein [Fibromonadales bacterium]
MMMKTISSPKDLNVWKEAMNLAKQVYLETKNFPKEEVYGLTSQIRRAAVSVPSNIAEGNGRKHKKEYINFLSIANGSLMELETQLILSQNINYLSKENLELLLKQIEIVSRLLNGLRKSLEKSCSMSQTTKF